jgi:hypothetical protein
MRVELKDISEVIQNEYTMREALAWYNRVNDLVEEIEILAEPEIDHIGSQWAIVVSRTATDQHLPQGPLSQFLSSVAFIEKAHEVADAAEQT